MNVIEIFPKISELSVMPLCSVLSLYFGVVVGNWLPCRGLFVQ